MVSGEITSILEKYNFSHVQVNIEELSLLYKVVSDKAYVIGIFTIEQGKTFSREQYVNIKRQISVNFGTRYANGLDILCILCTDDLEGTKQNFADDENTWIVDNKKNRLIIYENQPKDFLNLRLELEKVLIKSAKEGYSESIENNYGEYEENTTHKNLYRKDKVIKDFLCTISFFIIILNVLVYIFINMGLLVNYPSYVISKGALYWPAVFYNHQYYRIITYMFLHHDISHIANNMIILLILGEVLERTVGKVKFSVIYFIAGIVAGISSASYNMIYKYNAISVGASGAIFGVIGAMAYIVLVNKGRVDNISKSRMMLFVGMSLYSGLTSQSVDNIAHVSGLIAGVILAALLYRKDKNLLGRD